MSTRDEDNYEVNYETFRDCLSTAIIQRLAAPKRPERRRAAKGRKNAVKPLERSVKDEEEVDDVEDLAEFIDVCELSILRHLFKYTPFSHRR